jgi:transmembrane sensor
MSKIQFKNILQRYIEGTCTEQERLMVEQWYELLDEDYRQLFPNLALAQWEDELWNKIQEKTETQLPIQRRWYQQKVVWRVAASILLVGSIGFWYWSKEDVSFVSSAFYAQDAGLEKQRNTSTKEVKVVLSDGSEVTLSPNSTLEYPKKWGTDKREVFLTGNAFFKVARNVEKPFLVYSKGIVTKVLGTSFWVRSNTTSNQVEIAVMTGKVAVFKQDAKADYISETTKSGVILTPNQQVNYFPENQVFVTGIVKEPLLIRPDGIHKEIPAVLPSFHYDEDAVAAVLSDLEKAYGIEIIVENDQLSDCPFTADLSDSNLYTKLDIICATLKASYEVRGTKILISGKGCQ